MSCWEQGPYHREHFLKRLQCDALQGYHDQDAACGRFDSWVGRVAGAEYKLIYFGFYKVVGNKPPVKSYTYGVVENVRDLQKLANLAIIKKSILDLDMSGVPTAYNQWPTDFTFEQDILTSKRNRLALKEAIEHCIHRRVLFRNKCVIECSKRFDVHGHDVFLLILQTLRAKLLLNFND